MLAPLLVGLLAATPTIGLDRVLAEPTAQVRPLTRLAILLPKALPAASKDLQLYATASAGRNRYEFRLTSTPSCTANYCYAATFSARKGNARLTGRAVKLAKGRKARYQEMSCGASCAPASIAWRERGATYRLEAMIPIEANQSARLRAMANSAIKRGAR
jgi:hypothetical protein